MTETIHTFTKPDCPYCAEAKATLDAAGLVYVQHDVGESDRDANASIYFSGRRHGAAGLLRQRPR